MSMNEFLRFLEIVIWPAVAISAIIVISPYFSELLSGAKIKLSFAGQSIETTLPELEQVFGNNWGQTPINSQGNWSQMFAVTAI